MNNWCQPRNSRKWFFRSYSAARKARITTEMIWSSKSCGERLADNGNIRGHGCYRLHPSNSNDIEPRIKGYLYFPCIPFLYRKSRRMTDLPCWLISTGTQPLVRTLIVLSVCSSGLGLVFFACTWLSIWELISNSSRCIDLTLSFVAI